MKKAYLKKIVSAVAVAVMITTLSPLGVSAQWRENTDKTWNYIEKSKMVRGWKKISDLWYYFDSNGNMNTGWICDNGTWYYNNNSGEMKTGWIIDNGIWYYLDKTGAMKTGWIKDNGKWYYADSTGAMQTSSFKSIGITYHFNKSGELAFVNKSSKLVDDSEEINGQGSELITISNKSDNNQGTTEDNSSNTTINTVDVNGLPKLPQNYSISVQATVENKILELMNQKRTEAGLQPLIMDNTLLQIARYKSNHMIQYNYFDHTAPDGVKWSDWLETIGYKYTTTGENIAYNNYDAVELFNQWWNSPGHKANMMNPAYNKVGIGVIEGNGKYMGTQEFSN